MHHLADRRAYTTAVVILVLAGMRDRSDDPLHHGQTLPWSYISLLNNKNSTIYTFNIIKCLYIFSNVCHNIIYFHMYKMYFIAVVVKT